MGYAPNRKFRGRSGGFWGPKRINKNELSRFWGGGGGGDMYVTTAHDRLASIML